MDNLTPVIDFDASYEAIYPDSSEGLIFGFKSDDFLGTIYKVSPDNILFISDLVFIGIEKEKIIEMFDKLVELGYKVLIDKTLLNSTLKEVKDYINYSYGVKWYHFYSTKKELNLKSIDKLSIDCIGLGF